MRGCGWMVALLFVSVVGVPRVVAQCTGTESAKLTASDGTAGDWFGQRVSLSGDVALIGAHFDEPWGPGSGSAYVYRFDGAQWVEEQKLLASDGLPGDNFGESVAVEGNVAVVGASWDTTPSGSTGSAYTFRFDGACWTEQQHLFSSDLGLGLGVATAVSQSRALIGAWLSDTPGGQSAGAAYVFPLTDLALSASQTTALPGDTLSLTTCGGLANAPVGLFMVDVSGSPAFLHLGLSLFDAQGTWTLSGTVPSGLSGLTMDFQSYGFFQPTRVGASGRESIAFQ